MTTDPASIPNAAGYTPDAINRRVRLYVVIAALSTLSGSLIEFASMTDDQISALTVFRWTIKILLIFLTATVAGCNAYRAAIDRSTGDASAPAAAPSDKIS